MATIIDFISEEDYPRYKELLLKAEEAKKAAPKAPRAPRGPMSVEQKKKLVEARLAKAQADLEALLKSKEDNDGPIIQA